MKHTEFISFRCPLAQLEELEKYCLQNGVKLSEGIRLGISLLLIKKLNKKSPA